MVVKGLNVVSKTPSSTGRKILKIVIGFQALQNLCLSSHMGNLYSLILTLRDTHDPEI